MNEWRTDTPPKDRMFLADAGWPDVVVARWNDADEAFTFAQLAVGTIRVSPMAPEQPDCWFENESTTEIKKWMELPEVNDE